MDALILNTSPGIKMNSIVGLYIYPRKQNLNDARFVDQNSAVERRLREFFSLLLKTFS
jgi:hypothetical protein